MGWDWGVNVRSSTNVLLVSTRLEDEGKFGRVCERKAEEEEKRRGSLKKYCSALPPSIHVQQCQRSRIISRIGSQLGICVPSLCDCTLMLPEGFH